MDSAYEWKQYYRAERDRLGDSGLLTLVDSADPLVVRSGGAIVIPHTRIEITGDQIATAVATILASGVERVLALGVLHGARRCDRDLVTAARAGDAAARHRLSGTHDDSGLASEEFSLDAYGTPAGECLDADHPDTRETALTAIGCQLEALAGRRFGEFADLCEQHRSDFRDTGPVLAHLVGPGFAPEIHDLALVDYAEALDAPNPSWVAGALITV